MTDKVVFYTPDNDTKIAGLYDLEHTIGRGHYAVVKLARHVFTGEKVAVKVIDKTKLDRVAQDHLFQEVVCMKLVQHPNVVRLYEVIDTPTKLYLILELGDGGDLYDYIVRHGRGLHEKIAKRYFRQIVTAIAYCHNLHVVHRDLKPENVVFFEKLGLVKLTDFGFSNRFTPGRHLDTACGSLAYSAPEILLGDSYDAPMVDIWSLGVILYMLVCGHLPFEEGTDSETLTKIMDCDYQIPEYLSPECAQLISRLLVRDPQKRAHLDDILQADWLKQDGEDDLSIQLFSIPLVSKECLSFEDHMEILSKMSEGQLASVEEIQSTLDRNEYNHIAATYFLLAERKLKRNYIEQYKFLTQQAQTNERLRQQQQLQQNDETDSVEVSRPYNEFSGKAIVVTPRMIPSIVPSTEVRRFSMILEDEEEEEELEEESQSSLFPKIGQPFPVGVGMTTEARSSAVIETVDDVLFEEEEEEELMTVANLATVRSDLIDHPTIPALVETREPTRRTGSGVSMSVIEGFDDAESDVSLSLSTSGSNIVGTLPQSSFARSLPPSELRRRSYRRVVVPHRPLISVRSSPQLLKHIAEEEWDQGPSNGTTFVRTDKVEHLYKRYGSPRHSVDASAEDVTDTHSLHSSFKAVPKFVSSDDHSLGLRSRLSWTGRRALSTTHSPTRARRLFTSSTCKPRPTSIGSWNAAFNMSLLNEFRRRSFCSSPSEHFAGSSSLRLKPNALNQLSQTQSLSVRGQYADRRCSMPPSVSEFGPRRNPSVVPTNSPAPTETEVLPSQKPKFRSRSRNHSESENSNIRLSCSSENSNILRLFTSAPFLENVTDSTPVSERPCVNGDSVQSQLKRHSLASMDHRSPNRALNSIRKRAVTRSPNRPLNSTHKPITWSSSTPLLYNNAENFQIDYEGWKMSPSPGIPVPNCSTNVVPCAATTTREYCEPIREEEDEAVRNTDANKQPSSSDLIVRRGSDSSALHNMASESGSSMRTASSTRDNSLTVMSTRGSVILPDRSRPLTRMTASNFSLSSLATCLQDSRYMLDIIRGTFELQCHYNRHAASSLADSSGFPSGQASFSVSVRSLTGMSDNPAISADPNVDMPGSLRRIRMPHANTCELPSQARSAIHGHRDNRPMSNGPVIPGSSLQNEVVGQKPNESIIPSMIPSLTRSPIDLNTKDRLKFQRSNGSSSHMKTRGPKGSPIISDRERSPTGMVSIFEFDRHGDLRLVNSNSSDVSTNTSFTNSNGLDRVKNDRNNSNNNNNNTVKKFGNPTHPQPSIQVQSDTSTTSPQRKSLTTRIRYSKYSCCAIC